MTPDEIRILTATRSLQPTNSRIVANHLSKIHSWVLHRLYGSISPGPGLLDRGYVISSGTNTLRLTDIGREAIRRVGYINDFEEKTPVVIGEVVRYE